MTQEINLRKDLAAWYKFDAEWYDGNDILDASPNRIHATAEGGVTVDSESPIGGAATFDGSDDRFVTSSSISVEQGKPFTIISKHKPNDIGNNGKQQLRFQIGNLIRFHHGDNTTNAAQAFGIDNSTALPNFEFGNAGNFRDEWCFVVTTIDPDTGRVVAHLYDNNGVIQGGGIDDSWDGVYDSTGTGQVYVGYGPPDFGPIWQANDTALFAIWERVLNESEIEALRNVKGPMVQQL